MKIDTLRFKGVTCFTGEVALDFRQMPPGLIAIVGPNGAGKTTLMETMPAGIYRQMPTRGSVLDYATDKDSFIDLGVTFDEAGSFRARLNLDGVKGASDAVLERVVNGLATRLNDGKVTTFDAAVKDIFPPLDALLASAFAAQNRAGSFATRNKTERKDLFYTLLGLHRLDGYATTCRAAVALLERRVAELRGRLAVLETSASADVGEALDRQEREAAELLTEHQQRRDADEGQMQVLEAELVERRAILQAVTAALTNRAALASELKTLDSTRAFYDQQDADLNAEVERQTQAIDGRLASTLRRIDHAMAHLLSDDDLQRWADERLARIAADLQAVVTDKEARIGRNQQLLDQADDIRAAVAAIAAAEAAIVQITADLTTARQAYNEANSEPARARVREIAALKQERDRCARSAELLATVPCGGAAPFAACQFLVDAAAGRARCEALDAQQVHRQLDEATTAQDDAIGREMAALGRVRELESALAAPEGVIAFRRLEGKAKLLPDLEAAESRIAERQREIAAARQKAAGDTQLVNLDRDEKVRTRDAARASLQAERTAAQQTAHEETAALEARTADIRQVRARDRAALDARTTELIATLEQSAGAVEQHAQAQRGVEDTEIQRTVVQARIADLSSAIARLEAGAANLASRRTEFTAAAAERDRVGAALAQLQNEQVEWKALADVMGKDGLPVLEIDAAGPGVSAEANDLLQASFGGRFVVELVTQEPKADGKGLKEVFELKVYDHERGGEERDLSDLSGGEQVVVDEALKSAIALFVNRRNDRPIRTVWRDETTGALDPENALRYVSMLRRLHERAGLHHLFFVSHNPDVSAQADVQLQVADGRVTVAYPPFAPASASQVAA